MWLGVKSSFCHFFFRHYVDRFCKDSDAKSGVKKLTREQSDAIVEFSKSASIPDFDKSADLWNTLVEGRAKKVGKTSFKEIKASIDLVRESGYFEKKDEAEKEKAAANNKKEEVVEPKEKPAKEAKANKGELGQKICSGLTDCLFCPNIYMFYCVED
jgi:hypothetical protein